MFDFYSDPYISGVLSSFLADALKRVARRLSGTSGEAPSNFAGSELPSVEVTLGVAQELTRLAEELDTSYGDPAEATADFGRMARSREFLTYVDQLVARELMHLHSDETDAAFIELFGVLMERHAYSIAGVTPETLVKEIQARCRAALADVQLEDDAVRRYWEKCVIYGLDGIRAALDGLVLLQSRKVSPRDVDEFLETLRERIHEQASTVSLNMIGERRSLQLDDIYVKPTLTLVRPHASPGASGEGSPEVEGKSIARQRPVRRSSAELTARAVVLGIPGVGKSTLAKRICFDATNASGASDSIPIPVVLRHLARYRDAEAASTVEYIAGFLRSELELQRASTELVSHLLQTGRLAVVFDGLDEVVDPEQYESMERSIVGFCLEYKSAPVVVTSRHLSAYDQGWFPEFDVFELNPFDSTQVGTYVERWFSLDKSAQKDEQRSSAMSFMRESAYTDDLRKVPLMLTLMCSIYNIIGSIPGSRSEVYERCAELYLWDWDARRKIRLDERLSNVPPTLLMDGIGAIAYTMHADEDLMSTGISEQRLNAVLRECFAASRFFATGEEGSYAKTFQDFCTGRAWLLQPSGRDADKRILYQFSHRTFLEYFAAHHRVQHEETTGPIADFIVRGIGRRDDLVAELCLQIFARQKRAEVPGVVDAILDAAQEAPLAHAEAVASYLLSVVGLVPLTREVIDRIVAFVLEAIVKVGELGWQVGPANGFAVTEMSDDFLYRSLSAALGYPSDFPREALGSLLRCDVVSFQVLRDAVDAHVRALLPRHPASMVAIMLTAHLKLLDGFGGPAISRSDDLYTKWLTTWRAWSRLLAADRADVVVADPSLDALATAVDCPTFPLSTLLDREGAAALFAQGFNPFYEANFNLATTYVNVLARVRADAPATASELAALADLYEQWDRGLGRGLVGLTQRDMPRISWGRTVEESLADEQVTSEHEVGCILLLLLCSRVDPTMAEALRGDTAASMRSPHLAPYAALVHSVLDGDPSPWSTDALEARLSARAMGVLIENVGLISAMPVPPEPSHQTAAVRPPDSEYRDVMQVLAEPFESRPSDDRPHAVPVGPGAATAVRRAVETVRTEAQGRAGRLVRQFRRGRTRDGD